MKTLRLGKSIALDDEGAISIITGIVLLFVVMGIGALAVDIGRVAATKNELQNAADAKALAQASFLYPLDSNGNPNWTKAENSSLTAALVNTAAGETIHDYDIDSGYWNLAGNPEIIQNKDQEVQDDEVPAVLVGIQKSTEKNDGPIKNFFGSIQSDSNASAIATSYPPGSLYPESNPLLFPVAIHKSFADRWEEWRDGEDDLVIVESGYHADEPQQAGQWTSLFTGANDVPTVRDLIYNGLPEDHDPVSINDSIWIEPGTKTSIYYDVKSWLIDSPTELEDGTKYRDVVMAVVEGDRIDNQTTHEERRVIAFVGVRITYAEGKNEKVIKGNFIDMKLENGDTGVVKGPYYGVALVPALVK